MCVCYRYEEEGRKKNNFSIGIPFFWFSINANAQIYNTFFSLTLALLYLSYEHSNVSRTMGKRVWDAAPFLMVFDLVGCLINKIFILCFLYLFYHRVFQINFKFDWSVGGDFVFAFFSCWLMKYEQSCRSIVRELWKWFIQPWTKVTFG